jgi:hypothetical protein
MTGSDESVIGVSVSGVEEVGVLTYWSMMCAATKPFAPVTRVLGILDEIIREIVK